MKIIELDLNLGIDFQDEISLCLGYFDGLHKGHISLVEKAKKSIYKSALLTFSFQYKRDTILTSLQDKIEILKKMDLDYLFVLPFNEEIKNMEPEDFISKILLKLNVKEVIIGSDYAFGKNRAGNYKTLNKYSHYFNISVIPFVYIDNQKISSSLINEYLEEGNITKVKECLNRNYLIKAKVIKGKGNGHLFNYPTANLELLANYKLPKNGVYKGYAYFDKKKYLSMINVGVHPSIDPLNKAIVEVHLIDENLDLYNKELDLEFSDFIREEKKFPSIDELIKQLDYDKFTIKESENK